MFHYTLSDLLWPADPFHGQNNSVDHHRLGETISLSATRQNVHRGFFTSHTLTKIPTSTNMTKPLTNPNPGIAGIPAHLNPMGERVKSFLKFLDKLNSFRIRTVPSQ
jgi:hypothetical protein